eukprot:Transcript_27150.p1 GENE.Transcript_27150~~Transcript_27150.p1  ORF type:complete len:203 (+),score=60.25 Transcript_27150:129-737(+)
MPSGSVYFSKNGKCCANIRTDDLDLEHPKELMNLDVGNKRSTGQAVAAIPYGRFSAAPRKFMGEEAIKKSNDSLPSRLFLDPYHVSDGNLWAENFTMKRYQKGGQLTGLAGRSSQLVWEKERWGKTDPQSRARSKYVEPEGGRFVPALKPACSRDKGPDPYGTLKHSRWLIPSTGYYGGMGTQSQNKPLWNTYSLLGTNKPL